MIPKGTKTQFRTNRLIGENHRSKVSEGFPLGDTLARLPEVDCESFWAPGDMPEARKRERSSHTWDSKRSTRSSTERELERPSLGPGLVTEMSMKKRAHHTQCGKPFYYDENPGSKEPRPGNSHRQTCKTLLARITAERKPSSIPLLAKGPEKLGLDAFLERLESLGLDHVGSGLRLEGDFFLGERIDTLASLGGGLLDKGQLEETRNLEHAGALLAKLFLDEGVKGFEERNNFLAALAGGIRNALHNTRLGQRFGHGKKTSWDLKAKAVFKASCP